MHIGILITGDNELALREPFGSFADMTMTLLRQCGIAAEFTLYAVCDGEFPDSYQSCDGWAITGSPASVYDRLSWIAPLEALIRDIHAAQQPLLGICFGHQIIARALGGDVKKATAGWGLGLHRYDATRAGQALLQQSQLTLNAIHQDQVVSIPAQAQLLAGSRFCPAAMLGYGNHGLTLQAHPEFRTDYMASLLPALAPQYFDEAQADAALASLNNTQVHNTVTALESVIKRLFMA